MGKIIAIEKKEVVKYKDNIIEYFKEVNSLSQKESYQNIIDDIKNATSTVRIASTSNIDERILDAVHENSNINAYIILNNFTKSNKTVERFDERRVAIIREVDELENNFILIDNIAYLFVNPLNEKQNISFKFDESEASDLEFIFNYYFWNQVRKEKLINNINKATESPFPPFSLRKQNFINVMESIDENFQSLYIPRDKKYEILLEKEISQKYFSDDLSVPLYINDNNFVIGKFKINKPFSISNSWELKKSKLGDIDSSLEIIPRKKLWSNSIRIEETKEIKLNEITSPSIESMKNQKPNEFPREEYVKEVIYTWVVMPPKKPQNSKKASLYDEYKAYEDKKNKLKEEKNKNQELLSNKKKELSALDNESKDYNKKSKKIESEIKKLEDKLNQKENIDKPKYKLPIVGTLYENTQGYYLEISTYAELEKVKEYKLNKELRFVV